MANPINGSEPKETDELAEMLLVLGLLAAPIPIILVVVGRTTEILTSVGLYGLFILFALVLTVAIQR